MGDDREFPRLYCNSSEDVTAPLVEPFAEPMLSSRKNEIPRVKLQQGVIEVD